MASPASASPNTIAVGEGIVNGSSYLETPSVPRYFLAFKNGALREFTAKGQYLAPVWEFKDSRIQGASSLVMQSDGNLVIRTADGQPLWSSGTAGTGSNNRLVVQGDGNMVVYTDTNRAVWSSGVASATLSDGQALNPGQQLVVRQNVSPRLVKLVMQRDGNLVEYADGVVKFQSHSRSAGAKAVMQADGNFVIYSAAGRALAATHTGGHPHAVLELSNIAGTNFFIYVPGGSFFASF